MTSAGTYRVRLYAAALLCSLLPFSVPGRAQTPATQAQPASRLLGTVTATSADSLTLKLESGAEVRIQITPQTKVVRTAPGEKTLAGATMIHVEDLATGDRVLVRATPASDPAHPTAAAVITMKQADIAQAHATQAQDWQRHGVSGVVHSVTPNPATPGAATLLLDTGQAGRTLSVEVTPATIFRRYASDSVNFADAKPSTLDAIHPGDQLRARGASSDTTPAAAPGASPITAVEVVAGTFRNIAGTITAIDPAQNTLTLTDLTTKKPVTLHLTAETQMRKLPLMMAERLAGRAGAGGSAPGAPGSGAGNRAGADHPPAAGTRPYATRAQDNPEATADAATGEGHPSRDPAAMLQRAPTVTLSELKKGDAIMAVASQGASVTAITLIAGVEPLLEGSSSSASQSLFSASWNLNGSGGAETQQ